MTARLASVLAVTLLVAGCAVPSWVPFLGKPEEPAVPLPGASGSPGPAGGGLARDARGAGGGAATGPGANGIVIDRVVAVVNNDAITLGELQESVALFRQENRDRASLSDDEIRQQFLTRLIDTRLQLQEAEREKITVEDSEIAEELAERMKKLGVTREEEFEAVLRAQGLGLDTVKKRLRETIRVARLVRRKVGLRVTVTDPEIERYLEDNRSRLEAGLTYHARHILLVPDRPTDAGWEEARIRADLVRTRLAEGADFAQLAREVSRDASARDGGDLGTLRRGELAQDIEAQILALSPGEVSFPYRSSVGWHIFRLESKQTLEGAGLQRARQQVRDILYRQKYEARLEAWLKDIKQRAIIEVRM